MADHPFFAGLEAKALTALGRASRLLEVSAGDTLMVEGEPGDAAYLVLSGRFAVSVGGRLIERAGHGDLIGEMALLGDEPRSATVTCLRSALVVSIDGGAFAQLLADHPALHRRVSARLAERLRRANRGPAAEPVGMVLAVVGDESDVAGRFASELRAAFARLRRRAVAHPVGADAMVTAEVARLEADHDVVLLVPPPSDAAAVAAACDQADRVLVVGAGRGRPRSGPELGLPARTPLVDLVLVHPGHTGCPRGTRRWLTRLGPRTHHHVRAADPAHHDRVARRLLGIEVGLVLSGGGARGLAHAGAYRALVEARVPVDVIAGVSAGSIFALGIARGWDPGQVADVARRLMVECSSPVDPTLPTVALASGRRVNARIRAAFGDDDLHLEDLWIPTLIVSANLTTADVHEHLTGPAWRAVRATVAIPGVFPPMSEPEGLLVDGGIVDNLPVGRLRRRYPDAVLVASDAGRRVEFPPDGFPPDGEISGWAAWRLRRRLRRGGRRIPGLVSLLGRLTALGGAGVPTERGDVHIDHELPGVGMFDFGKGLSTMEAGHRRAREVLQGAVARRALSGRCPPVER